jgi:hypothetical protein
LSAQIHTQIGLSDPDVQVENGQILLLQIDEANRESDFLRSVVVDQYADFAYKVDGIDPTVAWSAADFVLDDTWTEDAASPIGYGEADGVLLTDVGQPVTPRPLAYYFRTTCKSI